MKYLTTAIAAAALAITFGVTPFRTTTSTSASAVPRSMLSPTIGTPPSTRPPVASSAALKPTLPPTVVLLAKVQSTARARHVDIELGITLRAIAAIRQAQAERAAAAAEAQRARDAYQSPPTAGRPPTTPTTAAASSSGSSVWSCIIAHESGGNPGAVNSSSGAGGLFQFLPSSWHAYGGSGLPEDASVPEQWAIAEHAQAESGWYPWVGDGCTPVG